MHKVEGASALLSPMTVAHALAMALALTANPLKLAHETDA